MANGIFRSIRPLISSPPVGPLGPGGVPGQPFPNISSGEVPMDITQLNPVVFGGLEQLRREGVFGREGIGRFQRLAGRASSERRRRIATGLRRGFGRRGLRSRSGAFTTALANASRGENEAMINALFKLFMTQETSKLGGLQGLQALLQQQEAEHAAGQRQRMASEAEEGGGGLLDFIPVVGPVLDIISDLKGGDKERRTVA